MPSRPREHISGAYAVIIAATAVVMLSTVARAQSPGLELSIEMLGFPSSEAVEKNTYTFPPICQAFGANLTKNRGLLGSGPFESVKCLFSEGKSAAATSGKNDWLLRIKGDRKVKTFEIFWRNDHGKEVLQAQYILETEAGPLSILAKKSTNEMIAYYLTTAMPFRSTVTPEMIRTGKTTIKGRIGSLRRIKIPTALPLFTLSRIDDIWQTTAAGTANMTEDTGKTVIWKATPPVTPEVVVYYAQQTEGRRDTLHQVDMLIQSDVDSFADKFLTLGRAGYMGVRYGSSIRGEGVLKKAKLIGLFGEFRSGILAGLKLNYDFTPVQKYSDSVGSTSYSWSRFQMGYGFSRTLPNAIFNWVDVTPRLGFTTLDLQYTPADDTSRAYDFKLKKAPTIGLEIGVESRTNYFIARLWGFGSQSFAMVPVDRNNSTNSIRGGVDFYRELFGFRDKKITALLFGAIDSTYITKKLSDAQIEGSQAQKIRNTSVYVGGGTTLTW